MKRIIAIIIGSLIIIGATITLFIIFRSTDFESNSDNNNPLSQQQSSYQLETSYFTAIVPAEYTISSNEEKESSVERLKITAENPKTNTVISIIVGDTPRNGLNSLEQYNMRTTNPGKYIRQSFGGMPAGVVTFYSKTNIYELTAFWTNSSLFAAITISSPIVSQDQINILMEAFLDQWQWR